MRMLEFYAYHSPLRNIHPIEKIVFALIPLILNILFQNIYTSLFIFFIMVVITIIFGKIPVRIYWKLLLIPVTFLLSSILVILLSFTESPLEGAIFQSIIGPVVISIMKESIEKALTLFSVSLSSISCLYFLILTTTIQDVLFGLQCLKVPQVLLDLIALIYRFIFLFLDSSRTIFLAQKARLGHGSSIKTIKSIGLIISALFVKVFHEMKDLNNAVNARSLNSYMAVIARTIPFSRSRWIFIMLISILIIAFNFTVGRAG
ncbi:cobalt ECF transporter T component CbiQ [Ureibacillus thermophilus]|uniref:Cobalt ECF transporter T component CbiQ n=1 Tax=Ureibacillus thermophilus TaxID=367743 RepID=A0A4P6UU90_9BACL|nr:cobalt ECF transporter T component CbiQ [Ureibacillus thermophilus]QBK26115.1 cobalt ECF transporter T component CbiQ [Ureibacillus thermophilus]